VVLGYGQDAGGRRWNRLAPPERAALQLLGHSTLEASAGLIGHRPDLLAQLLVRRHHHHLLRYVPPQCALTQQDGARTRDDYGSSVRVKSSISSLNELSFATTASSDSRIKAASTTGGPSWV